MLTVSKLNKEIFTKDIKCVSLGKLSSEVAEFILKKRPDLTDIISAKQEIIFWANRVAHTEYKQIKSEDGTGSRRAIWVLKEM